jgi:hypothetical protein
MARRTRRSIAPLLTAAAVLAAGAVPASAGAAELGDARVASHIGQQLVADVELTMVEDPSAPVQVRLASPEVYRGAGIAVPPALSSLTLSVMRRDGRQFLHATTLRPVDSDHLHLYVELVDKGQRAVRLVTLWLTPDPNPAPPPAPASAPAPAPAPVVLPPTAARPAAPAAAPAPIVAPVIVPKPAAKPEAKAEAPAAAAAAAATLPRPVPAFKLPAASHAQPKPAACSAQADEAKACAALGAKNEALRAQLGKLEEKVKDLQAKLGVSASAAAPVAAATTAKAAAAPAHEAPGPKEAPHAAPQAEAAAHEDKPAAPEAKQNAEHDAEDEAKSDAKPDAASPPLPKEEIKPAVPKPISAIKPLVPRKPKPKEAPADEGGMPWGWIGGAAAVLALAGGGTVALLRRRKRMPDADLPTAPGALDKLKERFASRTKPAPQAAEPEREAEPSLE